MVFSLSSRFFAGEGTETMTSNLYRKLGGMLTLAVVLSAAEARAQQLEKPGAPPADAAPAAAAPSGPSTFGDSGQLVVSSEQLFGYTYSRTSTGNAHASANTFSLLADPLGIGAAGYLWPRLGFDVFVLKGISLGVAASFFRYTLGNGSTTMFEVAPRLGYAAMVGPWLGVWPRVGFTYIHSSAQQYSAIAVEAPLVLTATPHLAVLVAPSLDLGITGSGNTKLTDAGLTFGLALTF